MRKLFIISFFIIIFANNAALAVNESSAEITKDNPVNKQNVTTLNFQNILDKAAEHSYDLKISDLNKLIAKQDIRSVRSELFPETYFWCRHRIYQEFSG